jgi:hypothetical protein
MLLDRAIDLVVDRASCALAAGLSLLVRRAHTGSHAMYLAWSMLALAAIVVYFLGGT